MKHRAARTFGIGVCLVLGLALSPAAHAAFTGSATAAANFSTARLPATTDSIVTVKAVCSSNRKTLTLTVGANGSPASLNELQVTLSSGALTSTAFQDLSEHAHSLSVAQGGNSKVFSYEILAMYRPPGTTNVWQSPVSLAGIHTC